MLLPMLSIYQEYVRNHHYSLQVSVRFDSVIYDGSNVSSVLILFFGQHCHCVTRLTAVPSSPVRKSVTLASPWTVT